MAYDEMLAQRGLAHVRADPRDAPEALEPVQDLQLWVDRSVGFLGGLPPERA